MTTQAQATHTLPHWLEQQCPESWGMFPLRERDAEKVMKFLRWQLELEGHTKARGWTVQRLVDCFGGAGWYDATGEELRAVALGVRRLGNLTFHRMVKHHK